MIYFTDGTKETFLTAFLLAYRDRDAYLTSTRAQLALGQEPVFVVSDPDRAARAEARLRELDRGCLRELDLLLRSKIRRGNRSPSGIFAFSRRRNVP